MFLKHTHTSKNLFSALSTHANCWFGLTAIECWLKIYWICVLHSLRSKIKGFYNANMWVIVSKASIEVNCHIKCWMRCYISFINGGYTTLYRIWRFLWNHEIKIKVNVQVELCEACIYIKAHRLCFGSKYNCSSLGELIFADICGPFDKPFRIFQYLLF